MLSLAILVAISFWFGWPRFRSGLDLGDEGNLAYSAVRVLEGQIPNRDFVSIQPPLVFYTVAVVFKLFGTSLLSLHALGFGIFLVIPLLIFGLVRQFSNAGFAFVAAVPAIFFGISFTHFVPYAVWQAQAASLAAVGLYLLATARGPAGWAIPAGVFSAVALLLRQDQGLYLLIATGVYTALLKLIAAPKVQRRTMQRALLWWLIGFASLTIPFAIYVALSGALPELFRQAFVFPLTTYARTSSSPFPPIRDLFAAWSNAYILFYYIVPLAGVAVLIRLVRQALRNRFGIREAKLAFLVILSALFYLQVLARSDLPHLLITLPPFFALAACGLALLVETPSVGTPSEIVLVATPSPASPSRRPPCQIVALGVAAVGIAILLWLCRPLVFQPPLPASLTLDLPRAGVRVPAPENLRNLVQTLQQAAPDNRSILCLPYQPMLYFLCQRRNPTRWNFLWPGDQTPAELLALVQQARTDPPAAVVLFEEAKMQSYASVILDYVREYYQLAADADGVVRIYLPK